MLNYFWWYSISWIVVFLLYSLNFSDLNIRLDSGIIIFGVISSLVSGILGWVFREKFKIPMKKGENSKNRERVIKEDKKPRDAELGVKNKKQIFFFFVPVIVVTLFSVAEFIIIRQVPLFKVVFLKEAFYQDADFVPGYHVILMVIMAYFAVRYIYDAVYFREKRLLAIICFAIIMIIFLLYLTRSYVVIVSFVGVLILASYLISKYGIKLKYLICSVIIIFIGLFGFGVFGNIRHGYKWDNFTFIEQIGLYNNWPEFLPKQLMWTYSYATSPLANLNYNVIENDSNLDIGGIVIELLPDSISKHLVPEKRDPMLLKYYFTASTGYAKAYLNGGYLGLYIMFGFLMAIGILGLAISKGIVDRSFLIFSGFLSAIYVFMMFDNMLAYVGLSLPFWVSFFALAISRWRNRHK